MATPFQWGMGGQKITSPEQAARQRAIAEALVGQSSTPGQNWSEGLADVAAALSGTVLNGRVDEAEAAGRERAGGLFANLSMSQSPDAIMAALTSPDAAWASDAQTSIASALLNQGMERADPMYQIGLETAQLELDALRNPVAPAQAPFTLGRGEMRFNGDGSVIAEGVPYSPDTVVNNNLGNTNDFFGGLSEAEGTNFQGFLTGGQQAARNLGQIQQLEGLLANSATGLDGAATQLAGEFGIDLGGASGVQAAQALINQMVPAQRQPGSGPMSDSDLALFKASLPRIINQPGGNELIMETLKAINAYDMELARITQQGIADAEITEDPNTRMQIKRRMREEINALQNPVTPFRERVGATPTGQATLPPGVTIRRLD